jgi:hypothetical protein
MNREVCILAAAQAAHEANRAWCLALGDRSQVPWEDAEDWQRKSAIEGIGSVLSGAGPEEQHEAWCAGKRRDGWVFGPVKDGAAKTHPCLVAYADLPVEQRAKDAIYIAVVRAVLSAGGIQ